MRVIQPGLIDRDGPPPVLPSDYAEQGKRTSIRLALTSSSRIYKAEYNETRIRVGCASKTRNDFFLETQTLWKLTRSASRRSSSTYISKPEKQPVASVIKRPRTATDH